MKRVISIFDTNEDGKVSFVEFLVGLGMMIIGENVCSEIDWRYR